VAMLPVSMEIDGDAALIDLVEQAITSEAGHG